jgi:GT2 family glycosyltransferase
MSAAWSVIVPTYNRPEQLARCLDALAQLQPPDGGYEIIVVNDGGVAVDDVVNARRSRAIDLRVICQMNSGPAVARNLGARAAAGRWLAFTDDDCIPQPAWLRAFERALRLSPDALAGGTVINSLASNIYSETSQRLAGFVTRWFDGTRNERFFTSNNVALARANFLAIGGFNVGFGTWPGEDREFCDRWHAQGRASVLVADAVVQHAHALSLGSFMRQHFGYGRGALRFRRVRGAAGRAVRVDPSFYIASVRDAVRVKPVIRATAVAALTMVAHAAYAAGLAHESTRSLNRQDK